MKGDRIPRGVEVRKAEKDNTRVKYNMNYISSTDIPDSVKQPGFEYYWERHSIRGAADSALDMALRRSWKPVPITRDPGRFCDILNRNPLAREYICQGDIILLERENEIGEMERAGNADLSVERVTTLPAYNFKKENYRSHSIGTVRN